jgi:phage FluMu gp28-like protein
MGRLAELLKAAFALLIWGGAVHVISTTTAWTTRSTSW